MTGDVREVDGKWAIRFERHMTYPAKEVWDYLTLPGKMATWLAEADVDPFVGGNIELRFVKSGAGTVRGTITALDEPDTFAHTWNSGGSGVRWELDADDDGCMVVLTHTLDSRENLIEIVASWHLHIDALSFALAGESIEWPVDRWSELCSKYSRMYG